MGVATQQTSGVLYAGLPEATLPCRLRFLRICGWKWELIKCNGTFQSPKGTPCNFVCVWPVCGKVFHWVESTTPICWTWVSGKSSFGWLRWTMIIWENIKRLSGKIPVFPVSPQYITTCKPVREETNAHAYFPLLPLHYPSSPSMFVLIDFCGVRSLGTAADRPAIHLQFKECSGRSVPFLFELYRTTTSSGTLPCQQRGWQGSTCVRQSIFYPLSQPPNQCSTVTGCQFNPYMQNYGSGL